MFTDELIRRYEKLLNGEKEPISREEDLFCYAYDSGVVGINLMEVMLNAEEDLPQTEIEKDALSIGYALGQKARNDNEEVKVEYIN